MKAKTKQRPEDLRGKSIKAASEEHKDSNRKINLRKVSIHSAGDGATDPELSGLFTPNDEQLAKINEFTRRTVTAEDVAAFRIDAMNSLVDRDDERFTPATVQQFADLKQPFSFVGKSYMADHEYKIGNTRGRIFDVNTKTKGTELGRTNFLQASIYTPKTPQYADFLENLDFGLNWAVSVGVVVDASQCSICDAPVYTSRFFGWSWCENGHEKGFYYVPGKEEEDSWGWYVPVDPSTKGAVKATVDLVGAIDGYEISQVFLGAQYMAQLADKSPVRKMFAAAERLKIPMLGLSRDEAQNIDLPHEPKQVVDAREKFDVVTEDGVVKWTDERQLSWAWDSNADSGEVVCLGKFGTPGIDDEAEREKAGRQKISEYRAVSEQAKQADDAEDEDEDPVELAESLDAVLDSADQAFDDGNTDQAEALVDAAETIVDQLLEVLGGTDADEPADETGENQNSASLTQNCENCGHTIKGPSGGSVSDASWDGSTSRFSDSEYKRSCAVCRGKSDKPKTDCSLPHHEPNGTVNRNGVHAAAGRIGQVQDLTEEQRNTAKSHLRTHYTKDLKEEVPDSLKDVPVSATVKEVLSAAMKAKLPQPIIDLLADAPDNGLELVLRECGKSIRAGEEKIGDLEPKAALGDRYVKELESDVLHWFVVSRRDPKSPESGVNVDLCEKLIKRCDGDPDMLKEMIEDYKEEAKKKFPQAARRSTVQEDPNERNKAMPDVPFGPQHEDRRTRQLVSRLHSTGKE